MRRLEERKRVCLDGEPRAQHRVEAGTTPPNPNQGGDFTRRWDLCFVHQPALLQHENLKGKSVAQIAAELDRDVLDVFLELALEEDLETVFERREVNSDEAAMAAL